MTPEQENEFVARWRGWRTLKDVNGMTRWAPPDASPAFNLMACEPIPPDYRADPALLWELMERLGKSGWVYSWYVIDASHGMIQRFGDGAMIKADTLAEAVFAAAVMQAEQEGK